MKGLLSSVAVMSKTNKSRLHLPLIFWKGSGLEEKKWVTFEDPSGRKWFVSIDIGFDYRPGRVNQLDLGYGWRQFRQDNELVDGDECISVSFKETPTRSKSPQGQAAAKKPMHHHHHQLGPASLVAGTSNEGSFVAVMTTNNKSSLHLPIKFWKLGGMEEKKWVMLEDPNGRKWFVNIRTIFDSRIGRVSQLDFGYGWSQFRNDNGLVDGDECEFSLVQEDPDKIKVIARPGGVFFVSEEED